MKFTVTINNKTLGRPRKGGIKRLDDICVNAEITKNEENTAGIEIVAH